MTGAVNKTTDEARQERENIARFIAERTTSFLRQEKLLDENGPRVAFVVWPDPQRAILVFHPEIELPSDFGRRLAAYLRRRVLTLTTSTPTNIFTFAQISYEPYNPIPDRVELDLASRPQGHLMLPLGVGHRGPIWLSLLEMDSVLIGGTRRMGKTTLLHAWILALVVHEPSTSVRLILYDGKNGLEFGRYAGLRHVDTVALTGEELAATLGRLQVEMAERAKLLSAHGARSIAELPSDIRPPYLVLIVDELAYALETPGVDEGLRDLISRGGAFGIHAILATQRPESNIVSGILKCNMGTRFALPVPDSASSRVILGQGGADKLPKYPGRVLFIWRGRRVEAQSPAVPTTLLDEILSRLRHGSAPLSPPQALEDWQRRLVEIAMKPPFNGRFGPIRELAKAAGVPRDRVDQLARAWEAQGLLGPVEYLPGGRKLPRLILPLLLRLAGITDLASAGYGGDGRDREESERQLAYPPGQEEMVCALHAAEGGDGRH